MRGLEQTESALATKPFEEAAAFRGRQSHMPSRYNGRLWMQAVASSPLAHCLAIALLVVCCFARTFGSYFLADDFCEIDYVHKIFHGAPQLLWTNFTGNYMQVPTMSVYRPWLLMTLVFDYLLWKGSAFGYYLSNLLYFAGDAMLVYLLVGRLTSSWTAVRSRAAAFFAAAIFATYPLHSESVSWVVGRVDVACAFYYLASLYCLTRWAQGQSKLWRAASLVSFWLALLTKEMAIGLPVVVAAIGFFLMGASPQPTERLDIADEASRKFRAQLQELRNRLLSAANLSLPFWASAGAYFGVRYLALGTFLGGYAGSIGESQFRSVLAKWSDLDTMRRLFLPFNYSVFQDQGIYPKLLLAVYAVLVGIWAVRLLSGSQSRSWIAFLFAWAASVALPIHQLWGLGYNLEGSRFYFFLTIPLAIMWPLVVLAPVQPGSELGKALERKLALIGSLALCALVFVFCRTCYWNNLPWVHASKEVRAVAGSAEQIAGGLAENQKAVVLGIPKDHGGAHMILNGSTFETMLGPPFTSKSYGQRFLTLDPILFGNPDLVDPVRLKELANRPEVKGIYCWNPKVQKFDLIRAPGQADVVDAVSRALTQPAPREALSVVAVGKVRAHSASNVKRIDSDRWLPCSASGGIYSLSGAVVTVDHPGQDDGLMLPLAGLDPFKYDFLELTLKHGELGSDGDSTARSCTLTTSWSGAKTESGSASVRLPERSAGLPQIVRVPLSRYWRWQAARSIRQIRLSFSAGDKIEISSARLLPAELLLPSLTVKGATQAVTGIFTVKSANLLIELDGMPVKDCTGMELEISKPDYFFDSTSDLDSAQSVMRRMVLEGNRGAFAIESNKLPARHFYQMRARCVGPDDVRYPYTSPITVTF